MQNVTINIQDLKHLMLLAQFALKDESPAATVTMNGCKALAACGIALTESSEAPPSNHGKPWSNKDEETVWDLALQRHSMQEIAEKLLRSTGSIEGRLLQLEKKYDHPLPRDVVATMDRQHLAMINKADGEGGISEKSLDDDFQRQMDKN